jgi:hypothetical protein
MRLILFTSGSRALKSRPAIAVYTLAVVAAFVGSYAYASIPGPTGVINACYATKSPHTLRVIDSTQKCPSGTTALNWNAAGPAGPGGVNGIQEFQASSTWVAPSNITHVLVEAWGAGGGGGGSSLECLNGSFTGGGGGGGGGYIRSVMPVTAGQTYTLTVGVGGAGGPQETGGSPGGTSTISLAGTVLMMAGGGGAGAGSNLTTAGPGGAGGTTTPGLERVGFPGGSSSVCGGQPGSPGVSNPGTINWAADGGLGGSFDYVNTTGGAGNAGLPGDIVLTW